MARRNFHVVEELIFRPERIMVWAAEICHDHLVELPSQVSIIQRMRTAARVSSEEAEHFKLIISFRELRAGHEGQFLDEGE
jgi:hypothetical protein